MDCCFFAHCITWKDMECLKTARPQCGQDTDGGGMLRTGFDRLAGQEIDNAYDGSDGQQPDLTL